MVVARTSVSEDRDATIWEDDAYHVVSTSARGSTRRLPNPGVGSKMDAGAPPDANLACRCARSPARCRAGDDARLRQRLARHRANRGGHRARLHLHQRGQPFVMPRVQSVASRRPFAHPHTRGRALWRGAPRHRRRPRRRRDPRDLRGFGCLGFGHAPLARLSRHPSRPIRSAVDATAPIRPLRLTSARPPLSLHWSRGAKPSSAEGAGTRRPGECRELARRFADDKA
jgi:hypothetical protein